MDMLNKLNFLMAKEGINKSQLAENAGIPKTTIYGLYDKGFQNVRLPTLRKLASYFGVTMEYLTNDDIALEETEKTQMKKNKKKSPPTKAEAEEALKIVLYKKFGHEPTDEEFTLVENAIDGIKKGLELGKSNK